MEPTSLSHKGIVAVDLGGTKALTVLTDPDGKVVDRTRGETLAHRGPEAVIGAVVKEIEGLLRSNSISPAQLAGVGIAFAGLYDARNEVVSLAPNLPGWENYPLKERLQQALGVPAYVGNDVTMAALGEHRFGAGQGINDMLFVAVGTGIGGGMVLDGRLYQGHSGTAGEVGHMVVELGGPLCVCGNRGCLEALSSGSALARMARDRLRSGESSLLPTLYEGELEELTAEVVFQGALQGDQLARGVVERGALALGVGLAALVNLLNPQLLVVGGGVAAQWGLYVQPAIEHLYRVALPKPAQDVRVAPSALEDLAGVLGAVALVQDAAGLGNGSGSKETHS